MARITNGTKTGTVPDDKLQEYLDNGWTRVIVGGGEEEGGEDESPSTALDTLDDSMRAAQRGITFGMNDVAAGVGAAAGDAYQSFVDGRERNPNAYAEGRDLERAGDEAARQRSPTAFGRSEIGGALLTAPLLAAKAPQVAARAASGAPVAVAGVQGAAKVLPRLAKGAGAGMLGAFGFGDVDELDGEAAAKLAGGAALGGIGELIGPPIAATAQRVGVRGIPAEAVSQGRELLDRMRPLIGKGAAALDTVGDIVPPSLLPRGVEKASKALTAMAKGPAEEAVAAPAAELDADDMKRVLEELRAPAPPKPARKVPDSLPDEPLPRPDPRTPASQIPRTGESPASGRVSFEDAAPEFDATGRPMTAQPVDDAEMAAMLAELTGSPQYRRAQAMSQTPAVTRQSARETAGPAMRPTMQGERAEPLDDIIARVRRDTAAAPNTNPVAIDDAAGRQPRAVAAVQQQELWRKTYDALPASKRQEYLAQIKAETGLPDDTIRQRLKFTKAEWARKSFNR